MAFTIYMRVFTSCRLLCSFFYLRHHGAPLFCLGGFNARFLPFGDGSGGPSDCAGADIDRGRKVAGFHVGVNGAAGFAGFAHHTSQLKKFEIRCHKVTFVK
jgi:hypothetical protein